VANVTIADLLHDGRVEQVTPDIAAAWERAAEARIHLASSATLAGSDPALAYIALYDAARKAITAHMQANGYRATNRLGAHQAVGLYAEATLGAGAALPHVRAFDRMRRVRNRSEYDQQSITERLLSTDLSHAEGVVAAVEAALPPRPRSP
jgi:hypothetical protein